MDVTIVGLVSSYKEGRLIQGAVRSLIPACDAVYVFEGAAGGAILDDVPATDLGPLADRVRFQEGLWRSDARKRTDIIKRVRQRHPSPLWGVWLDGDEVLFNGEYLRDWLQVIQWHDEAKPDERPHLGRPIRIVELDGSVGWTQTSVVRIDLIRNFDVSTVGFVNELGVEQGAGNYPDSYSDWATPRTPYFEADQMLIHPPIPGEPFVLHRSVLRHPARAGHRMHHQEAAELERRKAS